ncbi:iron complex outermembrane recepter protein [Gammaproteobacteria bacterium]
MNNNLLLSLPMATLVFFANHGLAEESTRLQEVVVTAPMMADPLVVLTDPKAPRQPVPAHDGADYLKNIPGFSVIRKGGTDGDPVLRGMAASRVNILLDGENVLGGCGMRMDPPTAYVFPESYDRITVIKGPQSVLHGPGNSAGTVLFERNLKRFEKSGWKFNGSLTGGSFGRNDQVMDLRAGTPDFYFQGTATRSDSDDYKDGAGNSVHSTYTRWSTGSAFGWTPDANTRMEITGLQSDGEAAYGDRSMDGVKFKRDNLGLKFEKSKISKVFDKFEANIYYNYVDHVMDNYSLRPVTSVDKKMVSNPDRKTTGGRIATTLKFSAATKTTLGVDYQTNIHTLRTGMGAMADDYTNASRVEDANFHNHGLFGELSHYLNQQDKLIIGLRADNWKVQDKRAMLTIGSGMMAAKVANPTANQERDTNLVSGFARFERDLARMPATVYMGLGRTNRFPDYWELISATKESATTLSAFHSRSEKTNQLDLGWIYNHDRITASISGFYNKIDDYLMVQSNYTKTAINGMGTRVASIVRNVDATTWGGEAGVSYALDNRWKIDGTLAYVHGNNDTDGTALAQMPPLEGRLGLTYDNQVWTVGALLRLVAKQGRYDLDKGNIVGQDLGDSSGFGVFSLNTGYRPKKGLLITGGVDNLFDKTYAEFISRGGAMVTGYDQATRINEPGRSLWLKLNLTLN